MIKSAVVPDWAQKYIHTESVKDIEAQISEIEKTTTGEVIVLIVRESVSTSYVSFVLFALLALTSFFLLRDILHNFWLNVFENILIYSLNFVVLFLFARILVKIKGIKRFFLHPSDMEKAFQQRAVSEYYQNNLYKTKNNTAVLIMVSLLERKAIVLASHELNKVTKEDLWSECIKAIVSGARKRSLGEGISEALRLITPILKERFPLSQATDNPNEIADVVLFKD